MKSCCVRRRGASGRALIDSGELGSWFGAKLLTSRRTSPSLGDEARLLARAGLVRARRRGREMVYELTPEQLGQARRYLDLVSKRWDEALERLRRLVED